MEYTKYVIIIGIILTSTAVTAQPKPEDQIKYRQSGMMFMRWNMGVIKVQVVKNTSLYNKERVINSANVIAAIANSGIESLFSDESVIGIGWKDTLVKPEYFERADEVRKLSANFKMQANELARVSETGEVHQIKTQFINLLDACKACHKKFRNKK